MERLTDDAQSVIAAFGYTEYVLVGHSMGGKVAQALAARRPAGLAGVVLVAPAPAAPVGSTEQLQELTMHAYDDEQTVQQSIDQMLTYQRTARRGPANRSSKIVCAPVTRHA